MSSEDALLKLVQRDLIRGRFRHGEWLRLSELCKIYDAGSFDVRQVLRALEALQMIEHVPRRGYRTVPADPVRDHEHLEFRLVIELAAAPEVMAKAEAKSIAVMREHAERFEWCIENGSPDELSEANHGFHRAFFGLCDNSVMRGYINQLREIYRPFAQEPYTTVAARRESAAEHHRMVDALERKDLNELIQTMRIHLLRRDPLASSTCAEPAEHRAEHRVPDRLAESISRSKRLS